MVPEPYKSWGGWDISPEMRRRGYEGAKWKRGLSMAGDCVRCHEPVEGWEQDPSYHQPMHVECGFRSVMGSVAHIRRECSCYVAGSDEGDPPDMTKRQAAQAALREYRSLEHG